MSNPNKTVRPGVGSGHLSQVSTQHSIPQSCFERSREQTYAMLLPLLPILFTLATVTGSSVRNIYWNTTTASQAGQPTTVIVNEGNAPTQYDQVNLICPVYKPGSLNPEQHIIYSVEKEEFDSCRVTNPRPRIVAVCNRPQTFMYFTITFRSFTPTPGGLEFRPGRDYYFISTSNTKDIHRRVGGWCSSHNMKMVFRVAENRDTAELSSTPSTPKMIPTPAAFWSKYWNARVPDTKDNYVHAPTYPQSSRDTYMEQLVYHPRRLDNSVDITITASALSSSPNIHLTLQTAAVMILAVLLM